MPRHCDIATFTSDLIEQANRTAKGRLQPSGIAMIAGDTADISRRTFHRISNMGAENIVFIEVQSGDYFGEDDLECIEDDYGRV